VKRLNPFAVAALIVAVLPVSCVKPTGQQVISRQGDRGLRQVPEDAAENAKETPMPDIRPATYLAAAGLFESQNQIASAAAQYQKAIAADPSCVEAHSRLGILLGRVGEHTEAERHLRAAVEIRPQSAPLRNNLGFEYALQERWQEAEAELRNAIRLAPDFKRAKINLGMVLCKRGRFLEGLETFQEAVPQGDAYYNYGLLLRAAGRYREATDAFNQALEIEPRLAAAKTQLEQIAGKEGTKERRDEGKKEEARTAEITPPTVPVSVKTADAAPTNSVVQPPEKPVALSAPPDEAVEDEGTKNEEVRPDNAETAAAEGQGEVQDADAQAPTVPAPLETTHATEAEPVADDGATDTAEPVTEAALDDTVVADETDDPFEVQMAAGFEESFDEEPLQAVPQFLGGNAVMPPPADKSAGAEVVDPLELPWLTSEPLPTAPMDETPESATPTETILPPPSDETKSLDEASGPPKKFNPNWLMARPGATSLRSEPFDQVEEFRPVIWEFPENETP
jgi:tetratricopeptide (TPR) repeat protein